MRDVVECSDVMLRGGEVANFLGVSRAKAYRMMQRREIPVVRFGKSIRSPRGALMDYVRQRTEHPVDAGAAA